MNSTPDELSDLPEDTNLTPEESQHDLPLGTSVISEALEHVMELSPDEVKLQQKRESGELSPHDFDLNEVFSLVGAGIPITQAELGNQALVLLRAQFQELGAIDIVLINGEEITIDADSLTGRSLIIFPEDLA